MRCEHAHHDEKRQNGQAVRISRLERRGACGVDQHLQSAEPPRANDADDGHRSADRHAQHDQEQKRAKADDAP
jgi:hypothetical protein